MCAECLGQGGERDVTMPAQIAAAFEMVQAEAVLQLPVVVCLFRSSPACRDRVSLLRV